MSCGLWFFLPIDSIGIDNFRPLVLSTLDNVTNFVSKQIKLFSGNLYCLLKIIVRERESNIYFAGHLMLDDSKVLYFLHFISSLYKKYNLKKLSFPKNLDEWRQLKTMCLMVNSYT